MPKKKKKKFFFNMSLKELRKKVGFKQKDIKKFKQASVSKIESRKDLKISTLIEYLECIDLDIEINAIKWGDDGSIKKTFTLLKTSGIKEIEEENEKEDKEDKEENDEDVEITDEHNEMDQEEDDIENKKTKLKKKDKK